jgi:hypothetical protein
LRVADQGEYPGNPPFPAAGTAPAMSGDWDHFLQECKIMANKFETLAFAIGFLATGFLTFVALPLA